MHLGIAGEVRCIVTKADGTVRLDTGYQQNLILNQGLDFFGGDHGSFINDSCAIGSGNSTPAVTQTKLDAFIAIAKGSDVTSDYSYVDKGDGLYRIWQQKKYRFTGLDDVNIGELGLVSTWSTPDDYYLTTRVLVKDTSSAPTSISLKKGETLDIYYKVHKVIDTRDKVFVVSILDGDGGSVPYDIVIRPHSVGSSAWAAIPNIANIDVIHRVSVGDLSAVTGEPSLAEDSRAVITPQPYVPSSYKRAFTIFFGLPVANHNIRVSYNLSNFYRFQMRFGRVSDDAPLTKTNKDTLTMPLELSWGRYEGEL